jgi:putative DNA methylase
LLEEISIDLRLLSANPPQKRGKEQRQLDAEEISDVFCPALPSAAITSRLKPKAGRMGLRLMAVVAEGVRERIYLAPTAEMESIHQEAQPTWKPDVEFFQQALGFRIGNYGMSKWSDLYTTRQLTTLSTFADLSASVTERIKADAIRAGLAQSAEGLESGAAGAQAYAEAVAVYLSLGVSRLADWSNTLTRWLPHLGKTQQLFSRHAIPMVWDFSELNPLSTTGGSFSAGISNLLLAFERLPVNATDILTGECHQADAQTQEISRNCFISTDPPYYDNIGYADLSDLFYVWLRRRLRPVFPTLLSTIAVPKADELVATPARHGSADAAEAFFLDGMTKAMARLAEQAHPGAPVAIYYAFKQSDTNEDQQTSSTGWETFLQATIRAGFALTGTWPLRTEHSSRLRQHESNALASSVVLVCRPRPATAVTASRRQFIRELSIVLPEALEDMTKGAGDDQSPVAPVDLSQAIIGPGMAVFSKYAAVLEADGTPMTVRTALQLINRFLAEDDFDHDTQFCLHWFEQHGWKEGKFGEADTLARAKGTSVDGVKQAGVLSAGGGIVRLLKWSEYPADWDPTGDTRLPIWEVLHQVIRLFKTQGESGAGAALAAIQARAEATRQLAYRLYTLCERAGWAEDARAYNEIVTSWSAIEAAAATVPAPKQATLFT